MNKNLTRVGFSLAMGLLFFACNNNPALEKNEHNSKQKLFSIQAEINQLEQEIRNELAQYKRLPNQEEASFEVEKSCLEVGGKKLRNILIEGNEAQMERDTKDKTTCQANLEIIKKISNKKSQIKNLQKDLTVFLLLCNDQNSSLVQQVKKIVAETEKLKKALKKEVKILESKSEMTHPMVQYTCALFSEGPLSSLQDELKTPEKVNMFFHVPYLQKILEIRTQIEKQEAERKKLLQ